MKVALIGVIVWTESVGVTRLMKVSLFLPISFKVQRRDYRVNVLHAGWNISTASKENCLLGK